MSTEKQLSAADAETDLAAALDVLAAAEESVENEILNFDIEGTDAAAKRLRKARDQAADAREFVGRAQRLLSAAKNAEEAAKKARDEARLAELDSLLDPSALRTRRLPRTEAMTAALVQSAEELAKWIEVERDVSTLTKERENIRRELYGDRPSSFLDRNHEPNLYVIEDELKDAALAYEPGRVRNYLRELARAFAPGNFR